MSPFHLKVPTKILFIAFSVFAVLWISALPAPAGERGMDRELAETVEKIQHLLREAEELIEAGHLEKAREVMEAARRLKEGLRRHTARAKERRPGKSDLEEILKGLHHGIRALQSLGKMGEAERLIEIAKDVERRLGRGRKREKPRGEGEREMVKKHMEIMRTAMKAFMEADRRDCAEQMEHAIHALELALEGRRDEKAVKIRETAPKPGQLAELLTYASQLWRKFKRPEMAESCAELGAFYRSRAKRRSTGRRETERHERSDRHQKERKRGSDFPKGLRGFSGQVRGVVLGKGEDGHFAFKVGRVLKIWKNNKASNPDGILGRTLRVEPRWQKDDRGRSRKSEWHVAFIRKLRKGQEMTLEIQHAERGVFHILELSEDQRAWVKRGDRERHRDDDRERHRDDDRKRHRDGDRERHRDGDRDRDSLEHRVKKLEDEVAELRTLVKKLQELARSARRRAR
ncbi:MAG: hypothetical protein ACYTHM_21915 [Planctomycetota bacterium]|jgi:hypothetical protein